MTPWPFWPCAHGSRTPSPLSAAQLGTSKAQAGCAYVRAAHTARDARCNQHWRARYGLRYPNWTLIASHELLAQTPMFAGLPQQYREQLGARLTRHEVGPNTEIVRQGDPADALFLIESGLVGVFVRDPKLGIVRLVNQLSPPDSFGEMALITTMVRNATCMSLEVTTVHRLGRDVFDAVIKQAPAVALGIARTMAERLQQVSGEREVP